MTAAATTPKFFPRQATSPQFLPGGPQRGLPVPPLPKEPPPAIPLAVVSVELPDDIKSCVALLREVDALPEGTPEDIAQKKAKRRIVGEHFQRLQHAPPRSRPLSAQSSSIWQNLAKSTAVVAALQDARQAFAVYASQYERLIPTLNQAREAARLVTEIGRTADLARVTELQRQHAEITGPAGEAARLNARRLVRQAFNAMRPAMLDLANAVESQAHRLHEELVTAEVEFFARHGLPREATALTRRFEAVRQVISNVRNQFATRPPLPGDGPIPGPHDGKTLIAMFAEPTKA